METMLPAEAASVRRARNIVMHELIEAGCGIDTIEVARLLTSELASNAVQHSAADGYSVVIDLDAGTCHVEIRDADPTPPSDPSLPGRDAVGGRGMWLIAELAHAWGVDMKPPGKRVWFELRC
ncbi:MAG TPA: ATP-binding protein [Mycobacteriales bacterium]|nr:ATP-binding protein [Mycobacteriales bacterium]